MAGKQFPIKRFRHAIGNERECECFVREPKPPFQFLHAPLRLIELLIQRQIGVPGVIDTMPSDGESIREKTPHVILGEIWLGGPQIFIEIDFEQCGALIENVTLAIANGKQQPAHSGGRPAGRSSTLESAVATAWVTAEPRFRQASISRLAL